MQAKTTALFFATVRLYDSKMLDRLFLYEDWANREVIARLRAISTPPPVALRVMAHIVGGQWLWYARLTETTSELSVWPELTLDECAQHVDRLREVWQRYLPIAILPATISYRNSKGDDWSSTVEDVLTHLVNHGTYHRGQIATAIREAGEEPPVTDFIHATRTGAI